MVTPARPVALLVTRGWACTRFAFSHFFPPETTNDRRGALAPAQHKVHRLLPLDRCGRLGGNIVHYTVNTLNLRPAKRDTTGVSTQSPNDQHNTTTTTTPPPTTLTP